MFSHDTKDEKKTIERELWNRYRNLICIGDCDTVSHRFGIKDKKKTDFECIGYPCTKRSLTAMLILPYLWKRCIYYIRFILIIWPHCIHNMALNGKTFDAIWKRCRRVNVIIMRFELNQFMSIHVNGTVKLLLLTSIWAMLLYG